MQKNVVRNPQKGKKEKKRYTNILRLCPRQILNFNKMLPRRDQQMPRRHGHDIQKRHRLWRLEHDMRVWLEFLVVSMLWYIGL